MGLKVKDTVRVDIPEYITFGQEGEIRDISDDGHWVTVHLGDFNGTFHRTELTLVKEADVQST